MWTDYLRGTVTAQTEKLLTSLTVIDMGGQEIAIQAARTFRTLRNLGVTVRCIESGRHRLHSDGDFEPFLQHPGLRVVT